MSTVALISLNFARIWFERDTAPWAAARETMYGLRHTEWRPSTSINDQMYRELALFQKMQVNRLMAVC